MGKGACMSIKVKALSKVDQIKTAYSNSPILKGLIDGGLSLIPFLGEAITSALDTHAFQLYEENSKRFVEELRQLVEILAEEKLDKRFIESDEFVSLLTTILARNARTHEREKIRLYANVFVNSATYGKSGVAYKEGFVRIIDELSIDHIRAMSFIYETDLNFTEEERKKNRDSVTASQVSEVTGITESLSLAYCEQMIRFGLLRDSSIGYYGYRPGDQPGYYKMTEYGREFAEFLQSPE
jgi:hypothetical protein